MHTLQKLTLPGFLGLSLLLTPNALAVTVGQVDDFEDGTTQGWLVGLLGAVHPSPPENVPTAGPAGVDDNFLLLTSIGGSGAGNRLAVINLGQWGGDYPASGVNAIGMDVKNFGGSDLSLRLLLADPTVGPPDNVAVSADSILLPSGGDWTSVVFPLDSSDLVAALGSLDPALHKTTEVRIFHSSVATFPGQPIVAQLGVDNIRAIRALHIPDAPSTALLFAMGMGALLVTGRRR